MRAYCGTKYSCVVHRSPLVISSILPGNRIGHILPRASWLLLNGIDFASDSWCFRARIVAEGRWMRAAFAIVTKRNLENFTDSAGSPATCGHGDLSLTPAIYSNITTMDDFSGGARGAYGSWKKSGRYIKEIADQHFFFVKKIFLIYFPASVIRFVRHTMHVTNTARTYSLCMFLWFGFFFSKFCDVFNNVLFNAFFQFEIVVLVYGKKNRSSERSTLRVAFTQWPLIVI